MARVAELLRDPETRLLTITGPGGTGKTRLAIEAADETTPSFPGGLWWVALAPLQDPSVVETAIADALMLREEGADLGVAIEQQLGGRRTLLLWTTRSTSCRMSGNGSGRCSPPLPASSPSSRAGNASGWAPSAWSTFP